MATDASTQACGDIVSRSGTAAAAERRFFEGHDAGNGQGAGGNPGRCAGSHRHDVLHGGGGAAAFWADDAVGTAEQIRHEHAAVRRRMRDDSAVEFSDGDTIVENDAGAGEREHGGAETGGGYAAIGVPSGASFGRGWRATGRSEYGKRRRAQRGRSACAAQASASDQLYGVHSGGAKHFASMRTRFQALQSGNGRQDNHSP